MRSINKIISITLVWLLFPLAVCAQKKHFEGEITYNMSIALDKIPKGKRWSIHNEDHLQKWRRTMS